jgi:hypothetical protein
MQIPDDVSFEASAFESDNDAYAYVWQAARKEALQDAESAVLSLGYTMDGDRAAFPSGKAMDRYEVIRAIIDQED